MKELISVIITTYNRKWKILNRALNSVLKQTYTNIEIIIINDSPNNLVLKKEIKEKIKLINDERIRYYCLKKNQGACFARNVGISKSNGKYIAFLDDDDEWLPKKLELQYQFMKKNSDIGLVYCYYYLKKSNDSKKFVILQDITKNKFSLFQNNYIGSTSFPLIKRECFEECKQFDINLLSSQDWDMWIRIIQIYEVAIIKVPLVIYHVSNKSITTNIYKRLQGWIIIFKKYQSYYSQNIITKEIFIKNIKNICLSEGYYFQWLIFKIIIKIFCILK